MDQFSREVVTMDQITRFNIEWPKPQGFPFPRVEISLDEFLKTVLVGGFNPDHISHHYLFEYPNNQWAPELNHLPGWTCNVIAYFNAAFLLARFHTHQSTIPAWSPLAVLFHDQNPGPEYLTVVRFFRLGCTHPRMTERSRYMFDHLYECPDCGTSFAYDSSG